jgi:hypothetical protein
MHTHSRIAPPPSISTPALPDSYSNITGTFVFTPEQLPVDQATQNLWEANKLFDLTNKLAFKFASVTNHVCSYVCLIS